MCVGIHVFVRMQQKVMNWNVLYSHSPFGYEARATFTRGFGEIIHFLVECKAFDLYKGERCSGAAEECEIIPTRSRRLE